MRPRALRFRVWLSAGLLILAGAALAAIPLSTTTPITQSFDGIGATATATLPADFRVDRPSTVRTVGSYAAAATATTLAGGANLSGTATNGIYNFGSGTTTTGPDRAVGFLSSGTATQSGNLYVQLTNSTGGALSGLQISYSVEKYRGGSNAAGFRFQLFYSSDGASWTSAGSDFLTSFAADAANSGFTPAPGATINVNAPLNVSIADGSQFYLAWNYSVASGTTTTNAQALAIDDISILGLAAGENTPSVQSTTPANGATNVAVSSTIAINFSESVTASASAFSLECPAGSPRTFTQTASPATTFTLTPSSPLPAGTTCAVNVTASQVTDTDPADPPDTMAADFPFSFATASPVGDTAPSVISVSPANLATGVPVDTNIVISFSESVTASASAFTIQCGGSPQTFNQSASPSLSFTLNPISDLPSNTTCTVTVTANQISDTDTNDPPDSMTSDVAFSFATPPPGAGKVMINEIDADTPGSDTAEFVELYDGGVGNTALDGLVVVFYDGDTGSSKASYAAFDLDGHSTDANGYFVMGNPGVAGASLIFDPGQFGLLQNGPDAVGLYIGNATDYPPGTIATTTNLLDAVVYGTDDPNASGLLPLLNAGQPIANENAAGNSQTQSNQRCPNGQGGFRNTTPYYPGAPTPGSANTCPASRPPSAVVISQLYGGGGNSGAPYQNDFVELFNRGTGPVDLTGWSLQYASASGSGWDFNKQPLGGTIGAGEYYLIALASNGAIGASLPPANISGQINMSGTSGKIALLNSFDALLGNCPVFDPHIMDLVGYGSADCHEGTSTAPTGSNTTSLVRNGNGSVDTDQNGSDFATGVPTPRQTAPIVELGPFVLSTDPRSNGVNGPRDATIQVTFTEPVDVFDPWFDINCAVTGHHTDATFARTGRDHYITPNVNFLAGEQCTVTIFKDQVHDQDLDDGGTNTDTLPSNYTWSFTVAAGTEPPFPPSVHLTMGNPTDASLGQPNNYLMEKPEFALSYNRDLGRPNWVSWHLSDEWIGTLTRVDTFRPDPEVPPDWYRVQSFDFSGSGFDRGHMTPNADRDKETSIPINQATFLMSNMVAQAPDNNQGPWAALEGYLRTLVDQDHDELYIVSGPVGTGGVGSNGPDVIATLANGHVTVPSATWKVALVIPKDSGDDISRVTCSARTIAVIMPNTQGIRNNPWETYLTTVDAVEALTGYDLFSSVPLAFQACIEAGTNGNNPPLDTTPANVTCASPAAAWHADNVSLACTASDTGSGLANPADASFSLATSVAAGAEVANASTNSHPVCDVAGNCATGGPIAGNMIDRKPPVVAVAAPFAGAVYQMNQIVNAAYGCQDGGSGVASCAGPTANGSPIDTSSPGTKTFVVMAADAVGNPSMITVNYEVKRTLTAVGTANVWVGLTTSGDDGLRVDLRAEVLVNNIVAATGDLNNVNAGGSGFDKALLQTVALSLTSGSFDVPAGAQLSMRVAARRTCSSNGRNSGTVREWFNGQPVDTGAARDAGSRVRITLGGTTSDYFLRNAFGLSTSAGSSRQSVDAVVNGQTACPARPFVPFGIWSVSLR